MSKNRSCVSTVCYNVGEEYTQGHVHNIHLSKQITACMV